MKKMILTSIVLLTATFAQASSIKSEKLSIAPSSIDKTFRLVDKNGDEGQKKLSIIVADKGMSTDVSPRYSVYLGYQSNAEMGNLSADFLITDEAMSVESAKRVSAGIYQVVVDRYRDGLYSEKVTLTIDATKMFADENKKREACGGDFCDGEILTSIEVKEKIQAN